MRFSRQLITLTVTLVVGLASVAAQDGGGRQVDGVEGELLWSTSVIQGLGTLSTDGRYLPFVDWSTGDLAIRDFASDSSFHVTGKGSWLTSSDFAGRAVLSRDGATVAYPWYVVDERVELRVRTVGETDDQSIFILPWGSEIEAVDWSPDDTYVLAVLSAWDSSRDRLVAVRLSDGSRRVLWHYEGSGLGSTARFAPDGQSVLLDYPVALSDSRRSVTLIPFQEGEVVQAIEHAADAYGPLWMPLSGRISFIDERNGAFTLWSRGILPQRHGEPPQLVHRTTGPFRPLGWTSGGDFLLARYRTVRKIYVAEVDVANGKVIRTPEPVSRATADAVSSASWSPDGSHIAYTAFQHGPGSLPSIVVQGIPGDSGSSYTAGVVFHAAPAWDPYGGSLLLGAGCGGFCLLDVQTGAEQAIAVPISGSFIRPGWGSRAESVVAMARRNGETSVLTVDRYTREYRTLYSGVVQNLSVSRDGRYAAFVTRGPKGESDVVMVLSVEGNERVLLPINGGTSRIPAAAGLAWTPDSKYLLFPRAQTGAEPQKNQLWILSVESGEARPLDLEMEHLARYGLDVHPDGKRIVFSAGSAVLEIRRVGGLVQATQSPG